MLTYLDEYDDEQEDISPRIKKFLSRLESLSHYKGNIREALDNLATPLLTQDEARKLIKLHAMVTEQDEHQLNNIYTLQTLSLPEYEDFLQNLVDT